jgi:ankyrin repeat protein
MPMISSLQKQILELKPKLHRLNLECAIIETKCDAMASWDNFGEAGLKDISLNYQKQIDKIKEKALADAQAETQSIEAFFKTTKVRLSNFTTKEDAQSIIAELMDELQQKTSRIDKLNQKIRSIELEIEDLKQLLRYDGKYMAEPVEAPDNKIYEKEAAEKLGIAKYTLRTDLQVEVRELVAEGYISQDEVYFPQTWQSKANVVKYIETGDEDALQKELDNYPSLLTQPVKGEETALYLACKVENLKLVQALIARLGITKAKRIATKGMNDIPSPLYLALNNKNRALFIEFLQLDIKAEDIPEQAPIDVNNEFLNGFLLEAVQNNSEEQVLLFLKMGANPSAKENESGNTTLHLAAQNGHQSIVKLLLSKASVNEKNINGDTPLHLAVQGGHLSVIKELCDPDTIKEKNNQGDTPLHLAVLNAENAGVEIAELLLSNTQALINIVNNEGNTALHMVAKAATATVDSNQLLIWLRMIRILLNNGINAHTLNQQDDTALRLAARQGLYDIVAILIESDVSSVNNQDIADLIDEQTLSNARERAKKLINLYLEKQFIHAQANITHIESLLHTISSKVETLVNRVDQLEAFANVGLKELYERLLKLEKIAEQYAETKELPKDTKECVTSSTHHSNTPQTSSSSNTSGVSFFSATTRSTGTPSVSSQYSQTEIEHLVTETTKIMELSPEQTPRLQNLINEGKYRELSEIISKVRTNNSL